MVPTVLSAVGLGKEITPRMTGHNLMPSACGLELPPDRPAFGAIYPNDARQLRKPSQHVRAKWVRDGHFKFVWSGPATPAVASALFNLKQDPAQQHNLVDNPDHASTVARLKQLLQQWWPNGDDSRVTAE